MKRSCIGYVFMCLGEPGPALLLFFDYLGIRISMIPQEKKAGDDDDDDENDVGPGTSSFHYCKCPQWKLGKVQCAGSTVALDRIKNGSALRSEQITFTHT